MYHAVLMQAKQISREDFVMKLRLIVGDNLIRAAIANLEFTVPIFFRCILFIMLNFCIMELYELSSAI